jgi:excinuclease ABC subunit A
MKTEENNFIQISNASEHNLKNINLKIPRDKFIVITGLSGSGKSSLAFDTLYAEGQRRYVESLSAYARQFLGKIKKPAVENISGLPPAVAIEQKTTSFNSRSTVGTATEIYDYLKLLFARIGKTISPISGKIVKEHSINDVVKFIEKQTPGSKILILAPLDMTQRSIDEHLSFLQRQGFLRVELNFDNKTQTFKIDEIIDNHQLLKKIKKICVVIDRLKASSNPDTLSRAADSIQTAFFEGGGICKLKIDNNNNPSIHSFSNSFEADGISFKKPDINMFNFNNPIGACQTCNGFGTTIGIDENLVIPNQNLSIFENAVACWRGEKLQYYKNLLIKASIHNKFPIHKPYNQLSDKEKNLLWNGDKFFIGIHHFFKIIEKEQHKIQNRVMLARFRGKTICPDCKGARLKKEASYVKINNKSIVDLVSMQLDELKLFFDNLKLDQHDSSIAKHLLIEIKQRLNFLCNVGLEYLTLNRASNTLSGGEMQRINLATALGSSLVGSLYILDEPTIGLHPKDTEKLINVLQNLQKIGNTVIVVEHDELIIKKADFIIDLGPQAGANGGQIVFAGSFNKLLKSNSLTAQYINGTKKIIIPKIKRKPSEQKGFINIYGARQNNLKNINVKIPLGIITAITGVSGSGKSSLIKDVLYPALLRKKQIFSHSLGQFDSINGDFDKITKIEFVDQSPIGRSSRSNPATYIKAYDDIRKLFALQTAAKINNFNAGHFSFNTEGGRCEQCKGEGYITIEMQFMADVTIICDSCNGKRFKDEILEVKFKQKNIYDILEMTIDQAITFFSDTQNTPKNQINILNSIVQKLSILSKVGLGYVKIGQNTSTLSGGESQRLKLASFMASDNNTDKILFIFDEPTTGLHFDDIKKLINAFNELVDRGHSIIFIEHNIDMIKSADWIIELGPEGGKKGGKIIFEGTPENLALCKKSHTAKFLNF